MSAFENRGSESQPIPDIHSACRQGSLESIKEAYKQDPDKLNSKDSGVITT
jgi:hypothetical protein